MTIPRSNAWTIQDYSVEDHPQLQREKKRKGSLLLDRRGTKKAANRNRLSQRSLESERKRDRENCRKKPACMRLLKKLA